MSTIKQISNIVKEKKLPHLDVEVILAYVLKKSREFILTYPEHKLTKLQNEKFTKLIKRRLKGEPIAYLTGHKEFYAIDFQVNKHTLIPRPETELIVQQVINLLRSKLLTTTVVDVGTGSGNIIISIAKNTNMVSLFAIDISKMAISKARKNAKIAGVYDKIKFLNGNLLMPVIKKLNKLKKERLIITANLPYLSKTIYKSTPIDVRKFEPKSALYSNEGGLWHYHKLLEQIKTINEWASIIIFLEISPEQKIPLLKIVNKIITKAEIEFYKDLAGKWRVCKITL